MLGVRAWLVQTVRLTVDEHILAKAVGDLLQLFAQKLSYSLVADRERLSLPLAY